MKLSTISVEKSSTSGWVWKLDQWVKKINTLKETIWHLNRSQQVRPISALLNTGPSSKPSEAHFCPSSKLIVSICSGDPSLSSHKLIIHTGRSRLCGVFFFLSVELRNLSQYPKPWVLPSIFQASIENVQRRPGCGRIRVTFWQDLKCYSVLW